MFVVFQYYFEKSFQRWWRSYHGHRHREDHLRQRILQPHHGFHLRRREWYRRVHVHHGPRSLHFRRYALHLDHHHLWRWKKISNRKFTRDATKSVNKLNKLEKFESVRPKFWLWIRLPASLSSSDLRRRCSPRLPPRLPLSPAKRIELPIYDQNFRITHALSNIFCEFSLAMSQWLA